MIVVNKGSHAEAAFVCDLHLLSCDNYICYLSCSCKTTDVTFEIPISINYFIVLTCAHIAFHAPIMFESLT
jgi:hypothetical protein